MTKKFRPNQPEKAGKELWLLNQDNFKKAAFWLVLFLIPTQLGLHLWPSFSNVAGIRVDYLSPVIYFTDVLIFILFNFSYKPFFIFLQKQIRTNYFLIFPIIAIGAIIAKSPENALVGIFKFFELLFFGHYVFLNISQKIVAWSFIPAAILQSAIAISQFLLKSSIGGPFYLLGERSFNGQTPGIANASLAGDLILRPYGTLPHPNVLAGYLLFVLILIFSFKQRKSKLYFLVSLIVVFAIFLTLSRTVIFLILGYFVFSSFYYAFKRKILKHALICLFAVMVIFLFLLSFPSRYFDFSLNQESILIRDKLVKNSISVFAISPIFGVGLKNFLVNLPFIQKDFFLQPVHNVYLLLLSETGILGLTYYLIFLFSMFK
ncbi:O-antigen ligase family protein, partial [Patescibacteria group bacterium]|nr:O-antigen ligase family protein [Patescibacteria group bacterium]